MQRWEIINLFILARGYRSFLEIGTDRGDTFERIIAEQKISVDPNPDTSATYCTTSDEFFGWFRERVDVIFIDGMHLCKQAYRDVMNGLQHLNRNGMIIMHDCRPETYVMQIPDPEIGRTQCWTGDVWKAFVRARAELPYEMYVIDADMGCGIIDTASDKRDDTSALPVDMDRMMYSDFMAHPEWFNYKSIG